MKKIFSILAMLIIVLPLSAQTQKYMGAFLTDDYDENGLGMTNSPGIYNVVADIPTSILGAFDGGKVVGMRFAVTSATNTSKCFMLNYTDEGIDTLAVARVTSTKAGWNEFMFDTPFTLDLSKIGDILMGYDYEQTSSNYPIAMSNTGILCNSYIGIDGKYYDYGLSDYGNLCVQAIVEKDYPKAGASGISLDDIIVGLGGKKETTLSFQNAGTDAIYSISYTITKGGVTSAEKSQFILPNVEFGSLFTFSVTIDAATQLGEEDVDVTITKVNGVENTCKNNTVSNKVLTVEKLFNHKVAVEEYTGTGCGYCPMGMVGLEKIKKTFGESAVIIALHQYSGSNKDAMYLDTKNYKELSFLGAPQCMIERGNLLNPYYGSASSITYDFKNQLNRAAKAGVEVSAVWSDDKKSVTATASVQSLFDNQAYDLEYVLVADGLTGTTTTWRQSNYFIEYDADELPSDMKPFGPGGKYGTNPIVGWIFDDVAIASSYEYGTNNAEPVTLATAYTPVQNTCTINMPKSSTLLKAIDYNKVYIVALVIDKETGRIVNADKRLVGDLTAVKSIEANTTTSPTATYNMAGQKVGSDYKGFVIKNGHKVYQR